MKFLFSLTALFFCLLQLSAQTYNLNQGGTITTCSGTLYDSGGPNGNYTTGDQSVMTFCPDGTTGTRILLEFVAFNVLGEDGVCFFDGPNTSSTSLWCVNSNVITNLPAYVSATNNNTSGCLTVQMNDQGIQTASGFQALISCHYPWQSVIAVLDHTTPASVNGYTNICIGDTVTFYGAAQFPQNGTSYTQSEATSVFTWDFGDGTTAIGQVVTHVYAAAGGYSVELKVRDNQGSTSTNAIQHRVKVSTTPVFSGTIASPDTICVGDAATLTGLVAPTEWTNEPTSTVVDTTALDDNVGMTFNSTINFDMFDPGQTLTNVSDLQSICLDIEHSYPGDLFITLTCPNGSSVDLIKYPNNLNDNFWGEPVDNDVNWQTKGVPYTYCWSMTASSSMATIAAANSPPLYPLQPAQYTYSYTDAAGTPVAGQRYIPAGTYLPEDANGFSDLIGCPLNGDWSINVTDNLNSDNGYIFNWQLNFSPTLYPPIWTFTPTFTNTPQNQNWSAVLNTGGIMAPNGSSVTVKPTASGNQTYVFTATDNSGCSFDTSLIVFVRPKSDPLCCIQPITSAGNNGVACGFSHQLGASVTTGNTGSWQLVSGPGSASFNQPADPNAVVTVSDFGTYVFRWIELYNATCKDSADVTVRFTKIDFSTIATDVTCNGYNNGRGTVNVSQSNPPYTYLWPNGNTSNLSTNLAAGTYDVTVRDVNSCDTVARIIINQPEQFNIAPSPDAYLCYGESKFIYAIPSGGVPGYTFFWDNQIDSSSIYVGPLTNTQKSVFAIDSKGCKSDTFVIKIYVDLPVKMKTFISHDTVCAGEPILISSIIWGGDGGPYTMFLNNETVVSMPMMVYPDEPKQYIFVAKDGCETYGARDTVNVYVYPKPNIDFKANTLEGCTPLKVSFNEENNNPGATYLWIFGSIDENNTSQLKNPTHTFTEAGVYDITLHVTSKYGCEHVYSQPEMITVYPKPESRFIADPTITSIVNPLVHFTNMSAGAETYSWSFGDKDSSTFINPEHLYKNDSVYNVSLIAINERYCMDTSFVKITITDEYSFYAPSAFSPNKDGLNDVFKVYGNGIDPKNFKMYIYDRWGGLIFETSKLDEGWRGIIKNNNRDVIKGGVYTWYVIYKDMSGVEYQRKGPVTLIH